MQLDKRARPPSRPPHSPVAVAGCGKAETFNNEAASDEGPSRLEQVKGSDLPRVVLTAKAAQRIGIETSSCVTRRARRTAGCATRRSSPTRRWSTTPRATPSRTSARDS